MSTYMLLLHSNPEGWRLMNPEEKQKAMEKFLAWRRKLVELGVYVGSDRLADDPGKVLRGDKGQVRVTDGPYSETKEVLGGYFAFHADSYEEASELCRDCPSLEYGGTLELRRIDDTIPKP